MLEISCESEGRTHRYFPDIFVSNDYLVEVKSKYTMEAMKEMNYAQVSTASMLYDIRLVIFNKYGEVIEWSVFSQDVETKGEI